MRAIPVLCVWRWLAILGIVQFSVGLSILSAQEPRPLSKLAGHAAAVRAVAYSPDGKLLLSASEDGKLLVRQRSDNKVLRELAIAGQVITSLAISADGKLAAVGTNGGGLAKMALPDSEMLEAWGGVPGAVNSIAMSRDGRWLLSGDAAGYTRLWDTSTKQPVRDFVGSQVAVTTVVFADDDTLVCSAAADGGLRTYHRETGQLLGVYFAPTTTALAIDAKEKQLLSTSSDGLLRSWRLPPEPRLTLSGHADVVSSLALGSDGKLALSGGHDGQALLWNTANDKLQRTLDTAAGKITAVALEGEVAVVGTEGGVLQLFNTRDGSSLGSIFSHKSAVTSLVVAPQATHVAATYADGALRWWRVPAATQKWSGHQGAITHLAASLDRRWLITCSNDKSVRVWNVATGKVERVIEGLPLPAERGGLSHDGALLAVSDATGRVRIETVKPGGEVSEFQAHAGPLAGLALIEQGKTLVTAGSDGALKYWSLPLAQAERFAKVDAKITASFLLSGDRLLVGDERGIVRLLSREGKVQWQRKVSEHPLTSVTLLADGATLITADQTGRLFSGSLQPQGEFIEIGGHEGAVSTIAPHGVDARFATAGNDGTIRLWKSPQRRSLTHHKHRVTATAISTDGKLGITADASGAVQRWNLLDQQHDASLATSNEIAVTAARFSNLGGAATGDQLGDVRFFADDARESTSLLGTHDAAISTLAFHPAAPLLATASADGRVRVWNVQAPAASQLARLERSPVRIALSGDLGRLFVACDDGSLVACDPNSSQEVWSKPSLGEAATCLAVSHDNSLVAVGQPTGEVHLFAALDGASRGILGTGYSAVRSIAFRTGSGELATTHDDEVIRVWKLPTLMQSWSDHTGDVTHAAISQGTLFATAGKDRSVRLWNTADANPGWILGHSHQIAGLSSSDNGARVATITATAARVWNTADGTLVREWRPLPSPGTGVVLSGDGKQLWVGDAGGKITLSNVDDGAELRSFAAHPKRVAALARCGAGVASTGDDALVKLWSVGKAEPLWSVKATAPLVALVSDAKHKVLLGRAARGELQAWSAEKGEVVTSAVTLQKGRSVRTSTVGGIGNLIAIDAGRGIEIHQPTVAAPLQATGLLERIVHSDPLRGPLTVLGDDQAILAADSKRRVILARRSLIAAATTTGPRAATLAYLDGRDRPTLVSQAGKVRHFDGSDIATLPGMEEIVASATTRDGNRIAAVNKDKSLVVWDIKQNRAVAQFSLPVSARTLSLSGDGGRAAVVGSDGVARVWQVEPPRQLRRISGGEVVVDAVLAPAGDWLAVAFENGRVQRFAAADFAEVAGHGAGATTCAYWPNGDRFLSGGADRYVRYYDREYKPQGQAGPFDTAVQAIAVRPDAAQVLVGDAKHLYVLRGDNLQIERKHELPGGCLGIQYLGQGATAVVAGSDNRLRTVQLSDGRILEETQCDRATASFGAIAAAEGTSLLVAGQKNDALLLRTAFERVLLGHQGGVTSLTWAAAGTLLVSGGVDKSVRQWNAADGTQPRSYAGATDAITSVAVSHDGNVVFAAGADRTLRAWPLQEPARQLFAIPAAAAQRQLKLSSDSSRVFVAGDDGAVSIYDAATGRLIEQTSARGMLHVSAEDSAVTCVSPDGSLQRLRSGCTKYLMADPVKLHELVPLPSDEGIAVSCDDKSIKFFDTAGKLLRSLAGQTIAAGSVSLASEAKVLAAAGDAAASAPQVWGWDPTDGRHLFTHALGANVLAMALSPSGKIAVSTSDRRVLAYDGPQLIEEFTLAGNVTRLAYLDDFAIAAIASDENLYLFRPSCEHALAGQQGPMSAAALSPDGKLLFTGGNEAVLRVWNTATGKQVSTATMPSGVLQVRVSNDGESVVTSGLDGKLLRWSMAAFEKEQADPPTSTVQLPIAARSLSLDSIGQRACVGCDDGWLRLFDLSIGKEIERQGPHAVAVLASVWSPDTGQVISSSSDRALMRGRLGSLAARALHKEAILALAVHSDGTTASVDAGGKLVVAQRDGKILLEQVLAEKKVQSLAWSPDGSQLAIGASEGLFVVDSKP